MARQANGDGTEAAAAAPVRRTPVVRESWGQGAWDTARNRRGAGGDEVGLAASEGISVQLVNFSFYIDHCIELAIGLAIRKLCVLACC